MYIYKYVHKHKNSVFRSYVKAINRGGVKRAAFPFEKTDFLYVSVPSAPTPL